MSSASVRRRRGVPRSRSLGWSRSPRIERSAAAFRPRVEPLEERRLLALSAVFSAGLLNVTSDVDVDIAITTAVELGVTRVKVNGSNPTSGSLDATTVLGIEVFDSDYGNEIDLSGVTGADFTGLSNVTIEGGDGDDTIVGSEFWDGIRGGLGNDSISPGEGINFVIYDFGDGSDQVDGTSVEGATVLLAYGTSGIDGIASAEGAVVFNELDTVTLTNVYGFGAFLGDDDDVAQLSEVDLAAGGVAVILLEGEADNDMLAVTGEIEDLMLGTGLVEITINGGTGNDVVGHFGFARGSAASVVLSGGDGDDTVGLVEGVADNGTTYDVSGGDGTDSIQFFLPSSDTIVIFPTRIELSDNTTIDWEGHADIEAINMNVGILGDIYALERTDTGPRGVDMSLYESIDLEIINSRIENVFTGIIQTSASGVFDDEVHATLVEDTRLKNWVNVVVTPTTDEYPGQGAYIDLNNVDFEMFTDLPVAVNVSPAFDPDPANIWMDFKGQKEEANYGEAVVVRVRDFDQEEGNDFQVFFKEQKADDYMPESDASWYVRLTPAYIGAPTDKIRTNQQAWDEFGIASAGLIAPSEAVPCINGVVGGLVLDIEGDEFIEPADLDPRVVLVTPWDGATFVKQAASGTYLHLRYVVQGQVPLGGSVKVKLTENDLTPTSWTYTTPINDGMLSQANQTISYTVRAFMTHIVEVSPSVFEEQELPGSATEATFTILADPLTEIALPTLPADADPVVVNEMTVRQIADAVGGINYVQNDGVAIVGVDDQGAGVWEYLDGAGDWQEIAAVSVTQAIVLPPAAKFRFVTSGTYDYDDEDPLPTLQVQFWYRDTALDYDTGVDITDEAIDQEFGTTVITLTQGFWEEAP